MKSEKWETCNKLEKEWWTKWKKRTDLSLVRKNLLERANDIGKIIKQFYPDSTGKILQIGPAANGEIHYLSGERYAIDPLASYFKANFPDLIDPDVKFIEGMAENLPYPDTFFDIILILNVLDHCSDPVKVLEEISRCLHNNGVLIVYVNIYRRMASVLHSIFNFLDREHPHALTYQFLDLHLVKHFDILDESFLPLSLPIHDKQKLPILIILKAFHLFPVYYQGIFKKR